MIALVFVAGLAWLWLDSDGNGRGPASAPAPEVEAAHPALVEIEELEAPRSPAADVAPRADELEPFVAARVSSQRFEGKTGSLRGHIEVTGEDPLPSSWRLVVRPSVVLEAREHAVSRALEFADGRSEFELHALPLGGYDVLGEAEGFNGQVLPVLLEPGNEHPFVNLRLVPAGPLEGRVLDAHGLPAEGVTLTLFAHEETLPREAMTDALGAFRFEKLPDGAYEILVGKATAPLLPERRPLRFQAPRLTFPDIQLPLLGELHVRVVDSLERPLEGVAVLGSGTQGGLVEGRTDYDGRLVARHLPGGRYRLRLSHPEFGEAYERRVAVEVVAGQVAEAPVLFGP